jgi:glycine/D-amino acid oxidase-like deaminating enzyme
MRHACKTHFAVIGAGAMGLWLVLKLSRLGIRTTLIEANTRLAAGSSTRNEGWLHSGAYHAAAINERQVALQVARRTREGFHQIRELAPEALEESGIRTFVLIREPQCDDVRSRWDEAGINYRRIERRALSMIEPCLRLREFAGLFEVDDRPVNTPVLYERLASEASSIGARILTGTRVTSIREKVLFLETARGATERIETSGVIFTAGYATKDLVSSLLGIGLPFRFWRSHLLDLPRFSRHAFFGISAGDATCMPHGKWSIVGHNADQEKLPSPCSTPCLQQVTAMTRALNRLARGVDLRSARPRACTKVDMDPGADGFVQRLGFAPPQLNVSFGRVTEDVFWLLPGKMTEAPFAADVFVRLLCDRGLPDLDRLTVRACARGRPSGHTRSSRRPIDTYSR